MQIDDPNFDEMFYTIVMKDSSEYVDDFKHATRGEIEAL